MAVGEDYIKKAIKLDGKKENLKMDKVILCHLMGKFHLSLVSTQIQTISIYLPPIF